ncbi:Surface-layer 125 kDa protein [Streptococcus pyogenes]|nr:Surface-layer 125 kDa protein [Streptococcus pyogenes]
MNKRFKTGFLALVAMLLVACSQGTKQIQTTPSVPKPDHHVRLVVKEDTNTIDEKVSFGKGDTVLEVLKDNYEVKEKDGFITAIDGIEQDTKANKYWLFKVNGKMADKGADQITV